MARATLRGETEQHPSGQGVAETASSPEGTEVPYSYFQNAESMQRAIQQQADKNNGIPTLLEQDKSRRDDTIQQRKMRQTTIDDVQRKTFNYDLGDSIFQKPPEDTE